MLTFFEKMFTLVLVLSVLQVNAIEISSYARVSKNVGSVDNEKINNVRKEIDHTEVPNINSSHINSSKTDEPKVSKNIRTDHSEGRAMQSSYQLPALSQLLRQPIRSNSYKNEKAGRFIVYPSYPHLSPNGFQKTQNRYNMVPSIGQQKAQRRFQYTPDQIYPFKGTDSKAGYKYSAPSPAAPPDQPPAKPPATFSAPIFVPPSPPKSAYLPADMMPSPVPGSHFLPTIQPEETSPKNPIIDRLAFPSHVNSSFMPPELDLIKNSIDSYTSETEDSDEETTYTPVKNLYNFPPNVDATYLPPMNMVKSPTNSYLPSPSGVELDDQNVSEVDDQIPYEAPNNLNNFPPNIESTYPKMINVMASGNSYLSPPSGNTNVQTPVDDIESPPKKSYVPPQNLYNFPPNIEAAYLPPQMIVQGKTPISSYLVPASGSEADNLPQSLNSYIPPKYPFNFPPNLQSSNLPPEMKPVMPSVNSYLPPASGSVSGFYEGSKQTITDAPQMNMAPPAGMMDMSPPTGMMDMAPPTGMMDMAPPSEEDHHHHHHAHPPWYGSDISYDYHDHHDHHDHHHHEEPPPTTTTTEAPEEPRVKKYSYYYLGRKLWYIPLYFTLWFCLYVAALIIRSIGRHKVDLPNHYVSRSLHDMSNEEVIRKINKMTVFTMHQIEEFKEKYL